MLGHVLRYVTVNMIYNGFNCIQLITSIKVQIIYSFMYLFNKAASSYVIIIILLFKFEYYFEYIYRESYRLDSNDPFSRVIVFISPSRKRRRG